LRVSGLTVLTINNGSAAVADLIPESSTVPVTCPKCEHQFEESVGRLNREDSIECPAGCGASLDTRDAREALRIINEATDRLGEEFDRINRRK
jgi:hypothetical protein